MRTCLNTLQFLHAKLRRGGGPRRARGVVVGLARVARRRERRRDRADDLPQQRLVRDEVHRLERRRAQRAGRAHDAEGALDHHARRRVDDEELRARGELRVVGALGPAGLLPRGEPPRAPAPLQRRAEPAGDEALDRLREQVDRLDAEDRRDVAQRVVEPDLARQRHELLHLARERDALDGRRDERREAQAQERRPVRQRLAQRVAPRAVPRGEGRRLDRRLGRRRLGGGLVRDRGLAARRRRAGA